MMKKKLLMTLIVATLFGCNDSNDSSVTNLNRAPVANPDKVTVMQGEAVSINVLDNDTDPDGDTLIIKELNGLLLDGNTAQYQSASDDLVGDKTFSYTITDGKLDAASSITISVTAKLVLEPALSRGEYAGSEACSTCHASVYEEWKDTKHATVMRKLYTEDNNTIDAPWGTEAEPKEFIVNSHKYTSFMKGEEYWLTVHDPIDSTKDRTYRIDVVGYKTQTNFFNYDAEANSLILMPLIYWNDEPEGEEYWSNWLEWLWYDKAGKLFPKEDLDQHIKFASYENRCAECHLTGFEIESFKDNGFAGNVVDDSNIWEAEFATGCENCHGPAAKHTRTMDKADVVNPDDLTGANYGSECSHCHQAGHPVSNDSGFVEMPYIYNEEDPLKKGQHFNVGDNLADFYVFTQRDL
ncbi:hypothetical protein EKG38_20230 [Shewanella canadensis]|uniref:Cytochrome c-552/4 domain-containing protein n=2 Tax=Shewanella canadensis TaxID=271096 RepID=A0A3S0RVK8_9GAMM|nr:hypothetical protein EKG38_20230 [Shewanella canadensis]